jgi:hypothetical protein
MIAKAGALKRSLGRGDGIWLNRFWTVRRPSSEVLERIAEELGDDLAFFDGDPRVVISVVRMLSEGRTFKVSEHIRVNPDEIRGLIVKAKDQG